MVRKMLLNSFCCFDGISPDAERMLWRNGFINWRQLAVVAPPLSSRKCQHLREQIPEMEAALEGRLVDYFLQRLPIGYRLRLWPFFAEQTAFLDLESTGLDLASEVTVVGLHFQGKLTQMIKERDLDRLLDSWGQIKLLITFNGERFDIPLLKRRFGLEFVPSHIDLWKEAKVHGYAGGLKQIEQQMGISRLSKGIDGRTACELWVNRNRDGCLQRLLEYNRDDVLNLRRMARIILQRSLEGLTLQVPALTDL